MRFAILAALLFLSVGALDARLARARRAVARDPYATLPAELRREVARRGCRPPVRPDADSTAVARGAFHGGAAAGVRDWAVLCMSDTATARVLVFRGGRADPTEALRFWATASRIPSDSEESRLCEGGVWVVRTTVLRDLVRGGQLADGGRLDAAERRAAVHDGILDGDCDGVSTVHYWTGRRWVLLPGGD